MRKATYGCLCNVFQWLGGVRFVGSAFGEIRRVSTREPRWKRKMPLAAAGGQFVADLSPNRLPQEAVTFAGLGAADCVDIMIAGGNKRCARVRKRVLAPAKGAAPFHSSGEKSLGPEAGWINGRAAFAFGCDDFEMACSATARLFSLPLTWLSPPAYPQASPASKEMSPVTSPPPRGHDPFGGRFHAAPPA